MKILIITGSKNDIPRLAKMVKFFKALKIEFSINVISCHRNLKELVSFLKTIDNKNTGAVIAVARSVANLPAVVAGYLKEKTIPTIGVALSDKKLNGIDSLLSVNSIPKMTPLMNTGIDEVGLFNAGLSTAIILSQRDKGLQKRLVKYLQKNNKKVKYNLI